MRKCKVCKEKFVPMYNTIQPTCSPACALDLARVKIKKEYKATTLEMKRANKSKGDWLKEAQTMFNRYIRMRDARNPCISCKRHHAGQYHAGHYKTVGAHSALRFHEMNCHKQCSACNAHLSGNIIEYRKNLLKEIGEDNLNWIEGPHDIQNLSIDDIKEIKEWFKYKLKLYS